jgi:hypothetical protein
VVSIIRGVAVLSVGVCLGVLGRHVKFSMLALRASRVEPACRFVHVLILASHVG